MSRGIPASTATAAGEDITRPYYLVEMGFTTPLRYSSTGGMTWDAKSWTAASIQVSFADTPTVTIFNENTTIGDIVLADGTSGRSIVIYQGFQNDASHPAPIMVFSGEMSDASIGETVTINCKRLAPVRTPRHFVLPPTFNHIPPAGTKFQTPTQIITLEGE